MTTVCLGDLFTRDDVRRAIALYQECGSGEFNRRAVEEIVTPIMGRINRETAQENNPRYVGYILEFLVNEINQRRK